jgi:hypothetical protein
MTMSKTPAAVRRTRKSAHMLRRTLMAVSVGAGGHGAGEE